MVRNRIKWSFFFLLSVLILNVFTKSLSIEKSLSAIDLSDTSLPKSKTLQLEGPEVKSDSEIRTFKSDVVVNARSSNEAVYTEDANIALINNTRSLIRNIRPGQTIENYAVKITFDGDTFNGEAVFDVLFDSTEDPLIFHLEALDIHEVRTGINTPEDAQPTDFNPDDGTLEIFLDGGGRHRVVVIEYSGEISNFGNGIFQGSFND